MALNLDVVGRPVTTEPVSWEPRDAVIYALGVGVGSDDPRVGLTYTTEDSIDGTQQVLPTYASLFGARVPDIGTFDRTGLLHAGQGVELVRPLPTRGSLERTITVTGIHDLGNAALVSTQTRLESADGEPYGLARSEFFIRGEGGFGGQRPEREHWDKPDRAPDEVVELPTMPSQALIYRLSGDLNPIHADPAVAKRAGFDRPILHGLSTFGVAGRALLSAFTDGPQERLTSIRGRFTNPVWPGDLLVVAVWREAEHAWFQVRRATGEIAIDRGVAAKTVAA